MLNKPLSCRGCPLHGNGRGFSDLEGKCSNGVLVIAEALGESEAIDGLPLRPYAQAGSIFQSSLNNLGLSRNDFGITNIVRCRPPNNVLDGASYEMEAISRCHHFLVQAISYFKPRVILALGNVPLRALTGLKGEKKTVHWVRGYVFPSREFNIPIVSTYHPSFLARGKKNLIGVFMRDILKAIRIAKGELVNGRDFHLDPMTTYKNNYNLNASPRDIANAVELLKKSPSLLLSYDIETDESLKEEDEEIKASVKEIKQFQVTWEKGQALVVSRKNYNEKDFREIMQMFLGLSNTKIGQNLWNFDDKIVTANGVKIYGNTVDIMTMYRHWQPDTPSHLQYIASIFGWGFAWKHFAGENLEWYGAVDSDSVMHIYEPLKQLMIKENLW